VPRDLPFRDLPGGGGWLAADCRAEPGFPAAPGDTRKAFKRAHPMADNEV
jgi:hypothetical protein